LVAFSNLRKGVPQQRPPRLIDMRVQTKKNKDKILKRKNAHKGEKLEEVPLEVALRKRQGDQPGAV